MKKRLLPISIVLFCSCSLYGQVGINTQSPNVTFEIAPKAVDGSTSEGVIMPRLSGDALHQADINGKYSQNQDGVIAFVTSAPSIGNRVGQTVGIDSRGYYYYDYLANKWIKILYASAGALVGSLDCTGATVSGSLTNGQAASGVTASIAYTGGNGGTYSGGVVSSTGVTGLTASISSGSINAGSGTLVYTISGTPSGIGTALFPITFGGQNCAVMVNVASMGALVGSLDCTGATVSGSLTNGQAASGVTASIAYTGGNGGTYSGGVVSSTGVTGLTASISSGSINAGSGTLVYTISGTPSGIGTALFPITFGGQNCAVMVNVGAALVSCGAYIAPGQWKNFMCHNLGSDMNADPFMPSASIHGAKYQWGATTGMSGRYYSQAQDQANNGAISGWQNNGLPNNTWQDGAKTLDDPCPPGYRVPTRAQWEGVINNNTISLLGTWGDNPSNYTVGIMYGSSLLLPISGFRHQSDGSLFYRGNLGAYWSTENFSSTNSSPLTIVNGSSTISNFPRTAGANVRCIAE